MMRLAKAKQGSLVHPLSPAPIKEQKVLHRNPIARAVASLTSYQPLGAGQATSENKETGRLDVLQAGLERRTASTPGF